MTSDLERAEYSLSTWLYVTSTLETALRRIAGAGFKHIELWGDQVHVDPRANPDVRAIKALVRSLGLQVSSIHCPFAGLDIGFPDQSLMPGWLETTGASLDIGADLGATVAVVHIRSFREPLANEDMERKSRDLTLDFVRKLNERARASGIRLAVENRGTSAILSGFAVSLIELGQMFDDQDIGFCLDIGHAVIHKIDFAADIRGAGQRLLTLHVHSNDGVSDVHWLPGRGVPDWQMIKAELAGIGYQGLLTLEANGAGDADATLAACAQFVAEEKQRALHNTSATK